MRSKLILSAITTLLAASPALAANWSFDTDHSNVGFSVRHMMISDVQGSFDKFKGTLVTDDKDITKSTVEVEIDMSSINTRNQKRDDHLRSGDFFDTAKFPAMKFKSTKVEKTATGLLVTGDLTLRGVTKPVVLTVAGMDKQSKDPWGNIRSAVKATGKINRTDFGLKYNSVLETGGVAVGEEVNIVIDAEVIKGK